MDTRGNEPITIRAQGQSESTGRGIGDHCGERSVAMSPRHGSAVTPRSKRAFVRHFVEMVVVMLVGMGMLEGVAALAFAAAGRDLSDQSGTFRVLLMGVSMTVPMVAWMRLRGHSARRNFEMAASMVVPSLMAAALTAGGLLGVGAALAVQHLVMVPAMLGVMLWRYDEYARPHTGLGHVHSR